MYGPSYPSITNPTYPRWETSSQTRPGLTTSSCVYATPDSIMAELSSRYERLKRAVDYASRRVERSKGDLAEIDELFNVLGKSGD